jgi:hypothetical protein
MNARYRIKHACTILLVIFILLSLLIQRLSASPSFRPRCRNIHLCEPFRRCTPLPAQGDGNFKNHSDFPSGSIVRGGYVHATNISENGSTAGPTSRAWRRRSVSSSGLMCWGIGSLTGFVLQIRQPNRFKSSFREEKLFAYLRPKAYTNRF